MSTKYPGGFITKSPVAPSLAAASGIWSLDQAEQNIKANTWPLAPTTLSRSLRFRSSASAYLNRTPASATNQKTWTWSAWVKRGVLSSTMQLFGADSTTGGGGIPRCQLQFTSSDQLDFSNNATGSAWVDLISTSVYRDPSAWYHIVCAIDTTQSTSTNRVKLYVNGVQITAFGTAGYPAQNDNTPVNSTGPHNIARYQNQGNQFFDGYLAEVNFIDGQQLTPSSFGAYDGTTGVWQPAHYNGTYGTNGFYLPFTDNSALTTASNAGLGKDFSGNANYWVTNNISLTAGSTYDSMTDVPTLTSATAANYAVINPIAGNSLYVTPSNGNLTIQTTTGGQFYAQADGFTVPSGKWYFEVTAQQGSTNTALYVGIRNAVTFAIPNYTSDGTMNGVSGSAGATWTIGDVISVAFDCTNGTIQFFKNGTSQGGTRTINAGAGSYYLFCSVSDNFTTRAISNFNFGQQPWTYSPPSGFVGMNTYNLPASAVPNGASYMAATLYTGTSASQTLSNAVGSASFQPDFVWTKMRGSASQSHQLYDSVRGVNNLLHSDTTDAEATVANSMTAFNSNGFTVGSAGNSNLSPYTYVGWNWKAGGTAVSNTNGSITSSVSANTTSGFSVVTYTGISVPGTVGHGLGVAPSMVIVKSRSNTSSWAVWQTALTGNEYLLLESTAAKGTASTVWNGTTPTSAVFSVGSGSVPNNNGYTYVAYCFAAIKGFSAFGSYTGNGSADGPFIYTGLRPAFVMTKRTDSASDWLIWDASRSPYNVEQSRLKPNTSGAEVSGDTYDYIDALSNGFKLRGVAGSNGTNASGGTYIYAAFAENPFQNALAR